MLGVYCLPAETLAPQNDGRRFHIPFLPKTLTVGVPPVRIEVVLDPASTTSTPPTSQSTKASSIQTVVSQATTSATLATKVPITLGSDDPIFTNTLPLTVVEVETSLIVQTPTNLPQANQSTGPELSTPLIVGIFLLVLLLVGLAILYFYRKTLYRWYNRSKIPPRTTPKMKQVQSYYKPNDPSVPKKMHSKSELKQAVPRKDLQLNLSGSPPSPKLT
ncbi:hypothetical protein EDD86DRAFT_254343, partial [Gorgonomyces haynaldii]